MAKFTTNLDYGRVILGSALVLTLIGLCSIYSASAISSWQKFGDPYFFAKKHAAVGVFGFLIIYLTSFLPIRFFDRITIPIVLTGIILCCLIFVPSLSHSTKGATRWINLGGLSFQPSEFAKLALVVFLAKNLSRKKSDIMDFKRGVLPNILVCGIFSFLLMLQPDFSSTVLLLGVAFSILFVAGLPPKIIFTFMFGGCLLAAAAVLHAPYRLIRFVSFLDPWAFIKNGGFQLIQSYVGFQNGGLTGVGFGSSKQKLYFLPEAHNDFILSVIAEEVGLFGVILIALLFASFCFAGFRLSRSMDRPFHKFLVFGLTSLTAFQASINACVVMGLLPTTGIPLPFVSSGASSLIVFLGIVAILYRMSLVPVERKNVAA